MDHRIQKTHPDTIFQAKLYENKRKGGKYTF